LNCTNKRLIFLRGPYCDPHTILHQSRAVEVFYENALRDEVPVYVIRIKIATKKNKIRIAGPGIDPLDAL
jgi:hypothetical protein